MLGYCKYANAYPDVFGEKQGTQIADAMDKARGGRFTSIPNPYPDGSWYTYDDNTCEYNCMVTEYHYWALTSILGAQENRLGDIQNNIDGWQKLATALSQVLDCQLVSSTNPTPESFDLKVFPNPFSNQITIELNELLPQPTTVKISHLSGKIIYENQVFQPQSTIQLPANLPTSFYLLVLKNGNGVTYRKLIKE